jgi:hypothetical protein
MEKKISLFFAILTLGFAQQIFAQDENSSADDSERWSDFLPFSKELAGDAELPLPFGIGVTGYWQEQDLKSNNISLIVPAFVIPTVWDGTTATPANIESEVDNFNIRLDTWLLPFLNFYGVFGTVEGQNKVSDINVNNNWATHPGGPAVTNVLDALALEFKNNGFKLDYEGDVYGYGLILAGQWGQYWGTIDYNYTQADLDISTSEIDTHTITPRIGRSGSLGNTKGSLWIGAMHQAIDEDHNGIVNQGGLDIQYTVLNEQADEWNFLIGGSAELNKKWNALIEGGFGERKQVMGNLTYRF